MYQNIYYQRERNLMHVWDDKRGYFTFPYRRYAYKKAKNGENVTLYGDNVTKVYKFDKKNDDDLFEIDIPETTRVLVDLYTDDDLPSKGHVILTYDIEVEMETGLPDVMKAENAITSIAVHDSVSDTYYALVMDKSGSVIEQTVKGATVIPFRDEESLLLKYLDIYEEINPTIVTGFNIDDFDTPYIYNRLYKLLGKRHANRLSPIGECFHSPFRNRYFMAGVAYLDYIELYKKFTYKELDNYRLDTIGKIELGRGKVEYEGNLDTLFKEDIEKFVEYNLVDVELVVELDRKLQFIETCISVCHIGHIPYEDVVFSSRYIEGAILTYLKRRGIVAPNKPKEGRAELQKLKDNKQDKFIGAYVKEPITGKHDWVYDLDLTSLYPSIIMSLNISPETKVGKVTDWDAKKFINGTQEVFIINETDKISRDKLKQFLGDSGYSIASNGVMYRMDKAGCIPDILDEWFKKRIEFRKLEKQYGKSGDDEKYQFYKKRQHIQKIMLNSAFGVLGLPVWRFYDKDNAEAITITGREIIQSTADMANLKYNKELGGSEFTIEMEDGTEVNLYPNTKVEIKRNGVSVIIPASKLEEGDDFVKKVGHTN